MRRPGADRHDLARVPGSVASASQVVGIIDTFLAGSRDARMAAVAFFIAFGLSSTRGRTLTEVAADLGRTKQALSR
jgi:hypothetical protein